MPRDTPAITIGGRLISRDVPPFVIAEIGINHGGDSTARSRSSTPRPAPAPTP